MLRDGGGRTIVRGHSLKRKPGYYKVYVEKSGSGADNWHYPCDKLRHLFEAEEKLGIPVRFKGSRQLGQGDPVILPTPIFERALTELLADSRVFKMFDRGALVLDVKGLDLDSILQVAEKKRAEADAAEVAEAEADEEWDDEDGTGDQYDADEDPADVTPSVTEDKTEESQLDIFTIRLARKHQAQWMAEAEAESAEGRRFAEDYLELSTHAELQELASGDDDAWLGMRAAAQETADSADLDFAQFWEAAEARAEWVLAALPQAHRTLSEAEGVEEDTEV
ncbi:MAG: hypothetical protein R3C68_06270 [Myxococcota bacterium]